MTRIQLLVLVAPLLVAAFAPEQQQGLSMPTLLLVSVAIVGVVVLRGVLLRRHLRKRPRRRSGDASTTDAGNAQHGSIAERADHPGSDGSNCD
ncbi:hypothetical protein [uncultured Sphingomonas sp.]|uniref:hypothetical protein n=1 Tax=uncultured Sphingomonas sp. TaxID=158754 RepID=UPI0025DEC01D|nr:hypothetical protein [uncultured Sphingomonas sp.]